jgi:hypothetical protein
LVKKFHAHEYGLWRGAGPPSVSVSEKSSKGSEGLLVLKSLRWASYSRRRVGSERVK